MNRLTIHSRNQCLPLKMLKNIALSKETTTLPKLAQGLSADEIEGFEAVYHTIVKDLFSDGLAHDAPGILKWAKKVLDYNVPHGKKVRGLMVPMIFKSIVTSPSENDMKLAQILGWCVEILQASCLVADDIMDESETRRGRPCWYKRENLGPIAFNDSLLLEHTMYHVIRKYFRDKPFYTQIVELFLDSTHKTVIGQSLDTRTGISKNLEEYSVELYKAIVKYKTSYYTILLPLSIALTMGGYVDREMQATVECLALEIGHFFQVQDDYLDCFGDAQVTGKVGTDIEQGKCTWLVVTAKERCTPEQWIVLKENYGWDDVDRVAQVKKLYLQLGLMKEYDFYEERWYAAIVERIKMIGNEVIESMLLNVIGMIYKRSK